MSKVNKFDLSFAEIIFRLLLLLFFFLSICWSTMMLFSFGPIDDVIGPCRSGIVKSVEGRYKQTIQFLQQISVKNVMIIQIRTHNLLIMSRLQ